MEIKTLIAGSNEMVKGSNPTVVSWVWRVRMTMVVLDGEEYLYKLQGKPLPQQREQERKRTGKKYNLIYGGRHEEIGHSKMDITSS
jgi:hypothetical protein